MQQNWERKSVPWFCGYIGVCETHDTLWLYCLVDKGWSDNHSVLLDKIFYFGIRGASLKMLKSFLSDRQQVVCEGKDYKSNVVCLKYGVPHGSL